MAQCLLTREYAIRVTKLDNIATCDLADIWALEDELFKEQDCLGETLRNAMITDLVDFSSVVDYVSGSTYSQDDVVKYKNAYHVSLENSNTSEPSNRSKWDYADMFTTACFNDFWCKYGLGEYLSRMLVIDSLATMIMDLNSNGLVITRGSDFLPAQSEERRMFIQDQNRKANRALARLFKYVVDNEDTCFDGLLEQNVKECELVGGKVVSKSTNPNYQNPGNWNIW